MFAYLWCNIWQTVQDTGRIDKIVFWDLNENLSLLTAFWVCTVYIGSACPPRLNACPWEECYSSFLLGEVSFFPSFTFSLLCLHDFELGDVIFVSLHIFTGNMRFPIVFFFSMFKFFHGLHCLSVRRYVYARRNGYATYEGVGMLYCKVQVYARTEC